MANLPLDVFRSELAICDELHIDPNCQRHIADRNTSSRNKQLNAEHLGKSIGAQKLVGVNELRPRQLSRRYLGGHL